MAAPIRAAIASAPGDHEPVWGRRGPFDTCAAPDRWQCPAVLLASLTVLPGSSAVPHGRLRRRGRVGVLLQVLWPAALARPRQELGPIRRGVHLQARPGCCWGGDCNLQEHCRPRPSTAQSAGKLAERLNGVTEPGGHRRGSTCRNWKSAGAGGVCSSMLRRCWPSPCSWLPGSGSRCCGPAGMMQSARADSLKWHRHGVMC